MTRLSFHIRNVALAATMSLLWATAAIAHHSLAPFDIRNPTEVTGVADKFVFRRPHPMLTLTDTEGVEWIIEVPLRHWERSGVPTDAIEAGDELVVLLFPARNGSPEGAMSGFTKNGQFTSVADSIGQREANAAADAIEGGADVREAVIANLKPGEDYETAGVHSAGPTQAAASPEPAVTGIMPAGDSASSSGFPVNYIGYAIAALLLVAVGFVLVRRT